MPYDGKLLARARAELEHKRARNQMLQQDRRAEVYGRVPEVRRIDAALRQQMRTLVQLTMSRDAQLKEKLQALEKENLDLQMRRAELLVENRFPMDYLDEIIDCPKCGDTGVLNGGVCSCLDRLYNEELTKELGVLLRNGDERFDRFELRYYSAEGNPSPRQTMATVLEICRKFAQNFPKVSKGLLMQGAPGLGKTFLSACIAREVAGKGCSVCYDTAISALEPFERQKFARSSEEREAAEERIGRMLSCDLMILDDLGTEMVTEMSLSALYTLINSRLCSGRKTIISTNLSDEELEKNYTPQICSRLFGEFLRLPFVGEDIRRLKD